MEIPEKESLVIDSSHSSVPIDNFIRRWQSSGAAEKANYVSFLNELCDQLEVPRPDPAQSDDDKNAYVFERAVTFQNGDGTTSKGWIDLYKRSCFVLEARQGWPPFLIVTDVGYSIEPYSDFTRSGKTYIPFPDARSHRILIKDLAQDELRERLRLIWIDPMALTDLSQ